ncbi:hypothetical protein GQ53DRAFT_748836, partial [Thozetella sp. PMI_491]
MFIPDSPPQVPSRLPVSHLHPITAKHSGPRRHRQIQRKRQWPAMRSDFHPM